MITLIQEKKEAKPEARGVKILEYQEGAQPIPPTNTMQGISQLAHIICQIAHVMVALAKDEKEQETKEIVIALEQLQQACERVS